MPAVARLLAVGLLRPVSGESPFLAVGAGAEEEPAGAEDPVDRPQSLAPVRGIGQAHQAVEGVDHAVETGVGVGEGGGVLLFDPPAPAGSRFLQDSPGHLDHGRGEVGRRDVKVAPLQETQRHPAAPAAHFQQSVRRAEIPSDQKFLGLPQADAQGGAAVLDRGRQFLPVGSWVPCHVGRRQAKLASKAILGKLRAMSRHLLALLCVFGLTACDNRPSRPAAIVTEEAGIEVRFPVRIGPVGTRQRLAVTELEKARGLMATASLPEDEGMAFLYRDDTRMSFWMKGTLLDLDIAFVAADGTILEIRTMQAGDTNTTSSASERPRFAVEMAAGWFARRGVKAGDKVDLPGLRAGLAARGFVASHYLP